MRMHEDGGSSVVRVSELDVRGFFSFFRSWGAGISWFDGHCERRVVCCGGWLRFNLELSI